MSSSLKQIITLFKKDVLLETRQQYTFYGVLLYVAATVFIIYLSTGQPENEIWNALFWIVQLFVCVNAVAKSFFKLTGQRFKILKGRPGNEDLCFPLQWHSKNRIFR